MSDIKWMDEATAVVEDIKPFVKEINISKYQPDIDRMVLFNLKTYEDDVFCIKLCSSGFGIASTNYDEETLLIEKWYETPYSMLSEISRSYISRFQSSLITKLCNLENTT